MTRPTFRESLRRGTEFDDHELARETLRMPVGHEPWSGYPYIEMLAGEPDWEETLIDVMWEDAERRRWAERYMEDHDAYYRRGPDGYSEYDLRREAESIREEEWRMREEHERDIVRSLGGRWW
ncbi:MAG: hypothetical protein J2P39_09575 [Candidatus Dormibacteraeota bacterium]|nr:hypothetical protein [Candidatus Dormibacteraeota bacterium]